MPTDPTDPGRDSISFHTVAAEELASLVMRREEACGVDGKSIPTDDLEAYRKATTEYEKLEAIRLAMMNRHLVGLAFSGGGIRSATFAVGVLHGLASLGLVRRFDYLSTVSGSGYAGAWLAAWIKRDGDPANVEKQLNPSRIEQARGTPGPSGEDLSCRPMLKPDEVVDEEPEPLHHLRSYSSFMTPRSGLLTADTWSIIAIWLRNILINMLVILPTTVLLVLAVRSVAMLYLPVQLYGRAKAAATAVAVVIKASHVPSLLPPEVWPGWALGRGRHPAGPGRRGRTAVSSSGRPWPRAIRGNRAARRTRRR